MSFPVWDKSLGSSFSSLEQEIQAPCSIGHGHLWLLPFCFQQCSGLRELQWRAADEWEYFKRSIENIWRSLLLAECGG